MRRIRYRRCRTRRARGVFTVLSLAATLTTAGALTNEDRAAAASHQPNVVFIMFDDLGYADLGSYGSQFISTPNLDAFAAEGMRFTQYYAAAGICSPTRASVLTGNYPQKYGIYEVLGGGSRYGLPTDETLSSEVLRDAGYATGHVGKWHVGNFPDYVPINQGFDVDVRATSLKFPGTGTYYDTNITINDSVLVEHPGEHLTEVTTDYAIDFITDNQAGPFYLNLWYNAPHTPLEPPAEWAALYPDTDEGRYAALVSDLDEEVGRLLQTLDDLALSDDTLVVITSDNGGDIGFHGSDPLTGPSNAPFRDGKRSLFEGGIRVPMMARWPGVVAPGTVDDSPIVSFDLLPTFAEAVGADVSALGLAGESFLGVLQGYGPKPRTTTLFFEERDASQFWESPSGILNTFAVRRDNWKLVHVKEGQYLFDLDADPGESIDLAAANPVIVDELLAEHRAWRLGQGLIPHTIAQSGGGVVINGDVWDFSAGGAVALDPNMLYNIDDSRFSFAATITPAAGTGSRRIAQLGLSWRLMLLPSDQLGLVISDAAGGEIRMSSATVLTAGQEYDIAFTVYAWAGSPATVRLYIDGVEESETNTLTRVLHNEGRMLFARGPSAFTGTLRDLQLYSLALTPDEILDVQAG